jgi:hypothetical protein
MARRILLIEPNYKNKYPPMGLMKISTYHKNIGDEVHFYKGEFVPFILEQIYDELKERLCVNDNLVDWSLQKISILSFIKSGSTVSYQKLTTLSSSKLVSENLKYYRNYFITKGYLRDPKWDRIYITTLFTFYWEKTIETVNSFKQLCKDIQEVKIGGIAATIFSEEIKKETGILPHKGLLDKGGEYDNNDIIIDLLPLDYSILYETDYVYPESNNYYAYTTRGCVNNCPFCAVPQLEPCYKGFISIVEQIKSVKNTFGEKRNLLLLDNNVLASESFDKIIDEIKSCGFNINARYIESNEYEVLIKNLKKLRNNYHGYIKQVLRLYAWIQEKVDRDSKTQIDSLLSENKLLNLETTKKEAILKVDYFFAPLFEKYRNKTSKARYVDFNQGLDARLLTEEKMKKLAEISIRPLRIAFDSWNLRTVYEKAVRLAAENGIQHISNYLLYNYNEKPVDLYRRMRLNIDLCDDLDVAIYSFPMKYHPIKDPKFFKNRTYTGKHWNKKFIRAVQAILNSTKGKIGRGKEFFEKAFGSNEEEYTLLLYRPEPMIIYRLHYEGCGLTQAWQSDFQSLPAKKLDLIKPIIHSNKFNDINPLNFEEDIAKVLRYYTITRDDVEKHE